MHDTSEIIINYKLHLRNNRGRDVFLHTDLITRSDLMRLIEAIIHASNDLANASIDITVNGPCQFSACRLHRLAVREFFFFRYLDNRLFQFATVTFFLMVEEDK